jgi:hypothetical protein|tara:strand:- start:711 stop:815 length:105 start_codon:yes stop_codon:yes gene_type:complete
MLMLELGIVFIFAYVIVFVIDELLTMQDEIEKGD